MESSYPSTSRVAHRRQSSISELSQPLELQHMASTAAAGEGSQAAAASRVSSASGRSNRATAADKQLSQIEKSVTHLLVATKQLLETLTQWSRHQASESDVSDVYVRLGYEFNLACRAFGSIGVDTSDLGPVPDLLRSILEDTLSQDASSQSLDRFLPRIRDIIINLLHGLKKKQAKLRSKHARDGKQDGKSAVRKTSSGSAGSGDPMDELSSLPRSPSKPTLEPGLGAPASDEQGPSASRNATSPSSGEREGGSFSEREAIRRDVQKTIAASASSSSISSSAMQNIPVVSAHSESPATQAPNESSSSSSAQPYGFSHPPPPPPPPTKQNDAIGLLQRSGELERRASRRFSQYQIQKHLGTPSNGASVIPSAQNAQVPNKGRDVRESLNAVRLRGSYTQGRQRPNNQHADTSPASKSAPTEKDAEHAPPTTEPVTEPPTEPPGRPHEEADSPTKTPTDKLRSRKERETRDMPVVGGKLPELPESEQEGDSIGEKQSSEPSKPKKQVDATGPTSITKPETAPEEDDSLMQGQFVSELSPPPGKELTLFLQYKSKIKKFVLPDGASNLSIGRLQLAFIEKFAWNTHSNGADLPEIYIQDPVSGVRHELEDLSDVKDRSVLALNVEALDEVKKHFDDNLGGLRRLVEGVREVVDSQGNAIQRLTDRQVESSKDIARIAIASPTPSPSIGDAAAHGHSSQSFSGKVSQHSEFQSLRRDLAVLRKTYSSFASDIAASMESVRSKAGQVKSAAVEKGIPDYEGDAGRVHINNGKKELSAESEKLVSRVDDLQDLVEDLRKDVVTRGVRPLPRQLEAVGRDISDVTKQLKKLQEFLKREKPIWTKIWEKELQHVCEERDQLTMQEDLAVDLEDDLEKATQTFALVEQATKQQNVNAASPGGGMRNTSKNINVDPSIDLHKAKDNMLGEVRALQPNHENRVEAIQRAEKARQKELENRRDGLFQKELRNFVRDGKLKKSGGIEEMERQRMEKEDRIRKEVWERQMGLIPPDEAAAEETPAEPAGQQTISEEPPKSKGEASEAPLSRESTTSQKAADQRDSTDKAPASPGKRSSWLPSIFSSPS